MQSGYSKLSVLALLAGVCLAPPALAQDAGGTDWSGFYAGVYAGYGLDELPSTSSSLTGEGSLEGAATLNQSFDGVDSVLGGLRGGWNYQHGAVVMGVEGTLGLGSFTRITTADYFESDGEVVPSSISQSFVSRFETNAVATFEGRFGVALDNWLLYGKAGLAVAHGTTEASYSLSFVDGPDPADSFALPASGSTSGLLFGSTVGFGAEVLVTENVSIGAEYSFLHLPAQELNLIGLLIGGGGGTVVDGSQGEIGIHTLKAGVNYHF